MRHEADAADAHRAHVDEPHTDRRAEHEHHHGRADEREAQPCDRLGERARGDRERRDDERIGGEIEGHVDRQHVREGSVSREIPAEPVDGAGEPLPHIDLGFPPEHRTRQRDVGPALHGIVLRQRPVLDRRLRPGDLENEIGELGDRVLVGVADVHRPHVARLEQRELPVDLVVDVAEAARLRAVAIEREGIAAKRLHDEVGDDTTVVGSHARPVGVERAHDADVELVGAVVGHRHGLGEALGLVVHATRSDRVDVAPVVLGLGVDERVAVHLARRGEVVLRTLGSRQSQRVVRAEASDLQDLDGDLREVDRRGRAREVEDGVDVPGDPQERGHVLLHVREAGSPEEVLDVSDRARDEVVDRDDAVTLVEEPLAQVRTEEAGATRDDDAAPSAGVVRRRAHRPMPR